MAELIAIAAPADQDEGTEMVVGTWFKNVGDGVTQNEPLLEITTDKVTVEIAAPASGILREILKSADQAVEPGEVLGRIEAGAAVDPAPASSRPAATAAAPSAAAAELTPAVRRLLSEHGLEASAISGTGKGGRITVQDVEAYLASRGGGLARAEPAALPSRRVAHTAMRRSIAQHMVQSVAVAPHVTAGLRSRPVRHRRPSGSPPRRIRSGRRQAPPTPRTSSAPASPRSRRCRK